MKKTLLIFLAFISISSLVGQISSLDKKDLKQISKSESKFDSGNTFKAIETLGPIFLNHKSNEEVWSLMFKFQMDRFESNQKVESNSLFEQTRVAVNENYYEDLTKLLDSVPSELILSSGQCEALGFLILNGSSISYKSNKGQTLLQVYGINLKSIQDKNCN